MNHSEWAGEFRKVYDAAMERYRKGERQPARLFGKRELEFLAAIGCSAQELFDFIDDLEQYGEPDYDAALLTAAVRREYFLFEQKGIPSKKQISMDSLPAKTDAVDGIAWLPRLIEKARAKLRGEMPPDLMYGCGGDRPFLHGVNVELSEFLRVVWQAGSDNRRVIDFVKNRRAQLSE